MATLTSTTPPRAEAARSDDLSSRKHRQLIGYVGLCLPVFLVVLTWLRPSSDVPRGTLLDSISAYYYTGAVAVFVGLLVALALFLFTYHGYENRFQRADRIAAVVAGVAALGVALFPTAPHDGYPQPEWWTETTKWIHYGSAAVLFSAFAVFSLWLFRKTAEGSTPSADKRVRNRVYLVCGVLILLGMAWTLFEGLNERPILLPEVVVLAAFSVSWLTKGHAEASLQQAAREVPSAVARALRGGSRSRRA